jgi:hypothetical protein
LLLKLKGCEGIWLEKRFAIAWIVVEQGRRHFLEQIWVAENIHPLNHAIHATIIPQAFGLRANLLWIA